MRAVGALVALEFFVATKHANRFYRLRSGLLHECLENAGFSGTLSAEDHGINRLSVLAAGIADILSGILKLQEFLGF